MSEYPDHDRVRQLLKRIDQITKESELLRRQIENIRGASPEWPDRRSVSRMFDDDASMSERESSKY